MLAISPDGTQLIYVANRRLYLRALSELEARPIQGTESPAAVTSPTFSPDGKFVAFWSGTDRTLKRVPIGGGSAITICPADNPLGMTWARDGLVFVTQDGHTIQRVSAQGGTPEVLVNLNTRESEQFASTPQPLPGGRGILFTVSNPAEGREMEQVMVWVPGQREPRTLVENAGAAWYLPTGHIVYAQQGKLFGVSFDPCALQVTSKPVVVLEGVARGGGQLGGPADFAVSDAGTLVYVRGPVVTRAREFDLALLDRSGMVEPLHLPPGPYEFPRVSPDGRQVAFGTDDGKEANVWIYDLSRTTTMRRLTFGGRNRFPVWSADGRHVAFQSDRGGDEAIFWQRADTSGTAERLTKPDAGTSHIPESWSPQDVLSFSARSESRFALWTLSLPDKRAVPFAGVQSRVAAESAFSPDGRWLAYQSGDWNSGGAPGRVKTYVQPFPATGAIYQISDTTNGFHQFWSKDGKQLFYSVRPGLAFAVDVIASPSFALANRVEVAFDLLLGNPPVAPRNYDSTRDGRRIGVFRVDASGPIGQRTIQVVLNWTEELKQRVPTR